MVDMHSHILYAVDDGPKTMDESVELLSLAVDDGLTDIISTSHVLHPMYNVAVDDVLNQVHQLQQYLTAHQLPLSIHTGHEIRIHENVVEKLKNKEVLSLANSRYVLIELPSSSVPTFTKLLLSEIQQAGYIPIIAHPERNKAIAENPEKLRELINSGALAQITAGSVAGHFGKSVQQLSLKLIEANCIHTYGSDVHNKETRPFLFDAGLTYLEKNKLADMVELLLENNARILSDDQMIVLEPEKIRTKKWWQLF